MKALLVGEANPYGGDPSFALYPDPPGCAGHRLCHKIMALDPDEYLERFERVNLCATVWRSREASDHARAIWLQRRAGDRFVLLGAKVARAFGWAFEPFTAPAGAQVVILPHPSGLSRAWRAPGAYERARGVLREAGVLL